MPNGMQGWGFLFAAVAAASAITALLSRFLQSRLDGRVKALEMWQVEHKQEVIKNIGTLEDLVKVSIRTQEQILALTKEVDRLADFHTETQKYVRFAYEQLSGIGGILKNLGKSGPSEGGP